MRLRTKSKKNGFAKKRKAAIILNQKKLVDSFLLLLRSSEIKNEKS
jgi:hypothetical protein